VLETCDTTLCTELLELVRASEETLPIRCIARAETLRAVVALLAPDSLEDDAVEVRFMPNSANAHIHAPLMQEFEPTCVGTREAILDM